MSRRIFFAIVAGLFAPTLVEAGPKLNVIVILADDLGYGDLSCYGHPKFKTPNLDRMAKEGARLTHFYTPVPFCAPTRGSLVTGRYPSRNGLTRNPAPNTDPAAKGSHEVGLPLSEITIAQLFKAAGYRTKCIGKWHLGHLPQFRPLQRGFDEYYGILYSNDMHRVELFKDDKVVEYPVVQATLTKRYTDEALAFIERMRGSPFFLHFCHAMPHKPLACSEDFYQKSGAGLYGDVIAELDFNIGRIFAKLKELGIDENTLVIFTSDNGPWYGGSSGGLRGMKGNHWEGGLRVPFIARWPGRIPAGHENTAPAITMDIFSTALAAAKVGFPKDRVIDGKDLMPVLTSKAGSPHEALFSIKGEKVSTVRSGNWKLHLLPPVGPGKLKMWSPADKYVDPRAPDGVRLLAPYEQAHPSQFPGLQTGDTVTKLGLFDLSKDPGEQRDVAAAHPEVVQRLQAMAARFQAGIDKK